jgi:hypothetical protein
VQRKWSYLLRQEMLPCSWLEWTRRITTLAWMSSLMQVVPPTALLLLPRLSTFPFDLLHRHNMFFIYIHYSKVVSSVSLWWFLFLLFAGCPWGVWHSWRPNDNCPCHNRFYIFPLILVIGWGVHHYSQIRSYNLVVM